MICKIGLIILVLLEIAWIIDGVDQISWAKRADLVQPFGLRRRRTLQLRIEIPRPNYSPTPVSTDQRRVLVPTTVSPKPKDPFHRSEPRPGGAACSSDPDCLSGQCLGSTCNAAGSNNAKVADGAYCSSNQHCQSSNCILRRCAASAFGKTAAGAHCHESDQCLSRLCFNDRCISVDDQGRIPAGSMCTSNDQCSSNYCRQNLCTNGARGHVSDGGWCPNVHSACASNRCINGRCAPKVDECDPLDVDCSTKYLPPPSLGGAACHKDNDCFSKKCFANRCAVDGPTYGSIGDGGRCDADSECSSGACVRFTCSTTSQYVDGGGKVRGGAPCSKDTHCYSGHCTRGVCSTDKPRAASVAAGGMCSSNAHCFSGHCDRDICAPDAAMMRGYKAGGAMCKLGDECFSGHCIRSICAAESPRRGEIGDWGHCDKDEQCFSGKCDVNRMCKKSSKQLLESSGCKQADCKGRECKRTECMVSDSSAKRKVFRLSSGSGDGRKVVISLFLMVSSCLCIVTWL